MEIFIVKTDKGVAYITNETAGLIVKVEKDRVLTGQDNGAIMEATLYREVSGFVPVCNYVFEAVDERHNPVTEINSEFFQSAVKYFFTVYLNTSYYVKKTPCFSSLYTGAIFWIIQRRLVTRFKFFLLFVLLFPFVHVKIYTGWVFAFIEIATRSY